ncbi:MAG: TIGR00159 family protein [Oligoflexales bacterium]|nr:TIGR00159 family protein [Oligoflexales bacterium]
MAELFSQMGAWAVVDILVIAAIIYRLILLIRGTRAMQMVLGIIILAGFAFLLSQLYPLTTIKWLMDKFYSSILIIIVILFQEDIRRVLSRMGKKPFITPGENVSSKQMLDEITRAVASLAAKKIGGLIVIERNIILSRYVDIGIPIDARISKELLVSIFQTDSPLHDGAVIIQQGRVAAAGCFLPLTRDENVEHTVGTRHRAAIGISQETDAFVVVVSEESATISLIVDGVISRGLDVKELRKALRALFGQGSDSEESMPPSSGNLSSAPRPKTRTNISVIEKMKIFTSGHKK